MREAGSYCSSSELSFTDLFPVEVPRNFCFLANKLMQCLSFPLLHNCLCVEIGVLSLNADMHLSLSKSQNSINKPLKNKLPFSATINELLSLFSVTFLLVTVVNGNKGAILLSKYVVDSEDKCCLVCIRTDWEGGLATPQQSMVTFNTWLTFFLFYRAELFTLKFGCNFLQGWTPQEKEIISCQGHSMGEWLRWD